jgi:hypothetical protein
MNIYLYFNSWGGSDEQSKYISDSLLQSTLLFKIITISLTNYGGFNPATIPDGETFHKYIISLTDRIVKQIVFDINKILEKHPCADVVLLSHSFGYNLLFECLKNINIKNLLSIILLDPAGKALTLNQLEKDNIVFKRFIQLFKTPLTNDNRYLLWNEYIDTSTEGLFTENEKNTGMCNYIKDCMKNNPLDLSIFGYGGDYFYIEPTMIKYKTHIRILTSTNGIANKNKSYWEAYTNKFYVVSSCGHFLQIYSQNETMNTIYRILQIRNSITPYSNIYNAPLNQENFYYKKTNLNIMMF